MCYTLYKRRKNINISYTVFIAEALKSPAASVHFNNEMIIHKLSNKYNKKTIKSNS